MLEWKELLCLSFCEDGELRGGVYAVYGGMDGACGWRLKLAQYRSRWQRIREF